MCRIALGLTFLAFLFGVYHNKICADAAGAPNSQVERYSRALLARHVEVSQLSTAARDVDDDADDNDLDDLDDDDEALPLVTCIGDAGISSFVFFVAVNKPDGLFLLGGELNPIIQATSCRDNLPDEVKEESRAFYRRNANKCFPSSSCSVGPQGCSCRLGADANEICEVRARVDGGIRNEIQKLLQRECS